MTQAGSRTDGYGDEVTGNRTAEEGASEAAQGPIRRGPSAGTKKVAASGQRSTEELQMTRTCGEDGGF
jgi:hypothetical protein